MFDDKKITKEKVKDLLYAVQNEFENEIGDFDYNGRELTCDDINMLCYYVNCFVNKVNLMIDDYLED